MVVAPEHEMVKNITSEAQRDEVEKYLKYVESRSEVDRMAEVKKITGERLASLYAYAISYAADCPLCTTYFRKIIIDRGEDPGQFQVDEDGQHLLSFGSAIAANKGLVPEELFQAVKKRYTDAEMVILVAFAGQMIATNIFNNVVETDIDDYLADYLPKEREISKE